MTVNSSNVSMDTVRRMKSAEPDQFHGLVKMHLSFLLDLHTDECDCSFLKLEVPKAEKDSVDSKFKMAFTPMKKSKAKGVMDGMPLTQEGVCQVYQIIEYLGRPHNIVVEGLFRKHGNLRKQQALKERLNKGIALNLDDEEFSVHEAASVLKNFLADLPEPLLTDAYYQAHCQVPSLFKQGMSTEENEAATEKQISCLQLLFQLIPSVNQALMKDLLLFLKLVTEKESENKMSANNLGTLFSTHILCPRKLSPEILQANHQLLSKAVTFMIEHAEHLFKLPVKLMWDIQTYQAKKDSMVTTPKMKRGRSGKFAGNSPIVSTIFSFVDREASLAATHGNETDHALAKLYAHVQGMPESAQKRRLVSKLNNANGKGTPDVATSGSVNTVGRSARQRRRSGDGLKNLLTPRHKRTIAGSYCVKAAHELTIGHTSTTFRRQNSLQTPSTGGLISKLSPSRHSSPGILSPGTPRDRLPSPSTGASSEESLTSEVSLPVDEVDTPGKDSSDTFDSTGVEITTDGEDLSGSYSAPPLPPRTPAPSTTDLTSEDDYHLSPGIRRAITTPRCRGGLMVCSNSQLDKWNELLKKSPSEDQDLSSLSSETDESEGVDLSYIDEGTNDVHLREKNGVYRTRSLSREFKQYLAEQGMKVGDDDESEQEVSYSEEVRRILRGEEKLSSSMQAILDGGDPGDQGSEDDVPVLEIDDVDSENVVPSPKKTVRRGIKRRSLTEIPPVVLQTISQGENNRILFETDL